MIVVLGSDSFNLSFCSRNTCREISIEKDLEEDPGVGSTIDVALLSLASQLLLNLSNSSNPELRVSKQP